MSLCHFDTKLETPIAIWRRLEHLRFCCPLLMDPPTWVSQWNNNASQSPISIFTQDRLYRLSLAASLSNGHPLFKPLWSECVGQPAVPLPRAVSQATYTTSLGMRSDRPQGNNGHNWGNWDNGQIVCAQWTDQNVHLSLSKSFGVVFEKKWNIIECITKLLL